MARLYNSAVGTGVNVDCKFVTSGPAHVKNTLQ